MNRDQTVLAAIIGVIAGLLVGFLGGLEVGHYEIHQRIINNPQGYVDAVVNANNEKIRQVNAAQNLKELESAGR